MRFIYFLSVILLCSCAGKPIKVLVMREETENADTLVFDGEDTLITSSSMDSIFLSSRGKHSFTRNGSSPREFFTGDKKGILNLDDAEFVVFDIEYETAGTGGTFPGMENLPHNASRSSFIVNYTIIDSTLVYNGLAMIDSVEFLHAIIDSVLSSKSGNYTVASMVKNSKRLYEDPDSQVIHGFKKIGKNKLFIEKFWDYDMDETIPETITIQTSSSSAYFQPGEVKRSIMPAYGYLFYASMSSDTHTVIDIRDYLGGKTITQ
jgi:hypothetical protein